MRVIAYGVIVFIQEGCIAGVTLESKAALCGLASTFSGFKARRQMLLCGEVL